MKRIILAYSKKGIRALLRKEGTIVSLTPEVDFLLKQQGVKFKGVTDYGIKTQDYGPIFKRSIALFRSWGEMRVGSKTISQHLTFSGLPLWKTVEHDAAELHLEYIMLYASILETVVRKEKPDIIITNRVRNLHFLPRDRIFFPELIESVAAKHGIEMELSTPPTQAFLQPLVSSGMRTLNSIRSKQRSKMESYALTSRRKALFVLNGNGLDKTSPVQEELQKDVDAIAVCTDGVRGNRCADYLGRDSLMYAYYQTLLDAASLRRAESFRERCLKLWDRVQTRRFEYEGIDLLPPFRHQMEEYFRLRFFEIAKMVAGLTKAYEKFKPYIVITVNDQVYFARAAVMLAKLGGIKTLLIQHAKDIDPSCRVEPLSDFIATWRDVTRTLDDGVDPSRFFVVGSTKEKTLTEDLKGADAKGVREELGIGRRKAVLFATRYPATRDLFRIKEFWGIIKSRNDAVGIVKVHPAETQFDRREFEKTFPGLIFLKSYDFVKLLSVADIVVSSQECTTSMDAIMAKKPLITLKFEGGYDQPMTALIDFEGAPIVSSESPAQFRKDLVGLLKDTEARKEISQRLGRFRMFKENAHPEKEIAEFVLHQ